VKLRRETCRVGKGALAPCPPFLSTERRKRWARRCALPVDGHMDDKQKALIDQVLSRNDENVALLEFERLGDVAFDEICRRMTAQSLPPHVQALALRRLALLARQACAKRKEELLDLALERLNSDDFIVRSGAANVAIWTTMILERTPSLVSRAENKPGATPSLRERVKVAVAQALQLGLDKAQTKFAREFLAH
jgi:hypothetical protein